MNNSLSVESKFGNSPNKVKIYYSIRHGVNGYYIKLRTSVINTQGIIKMKTQ